MIVVSAWGEYATSSVDGFLATFFFLAGPLFLVLEGAQIINFGYSKFAVQSVDFTPMIPTRLAMTIIYFPSMCIFPIALFLIGFGTSPETSDRYHRTVGCVLTAHFAKRVLETLFLHNYSGCVRLFTCLLIASLYIIVSVIFLLSCLRDKDDSCDWLCLGTPHFRSKPVFVTGIVVWALGTFGNLYHHWLLARLRSATTGGKYDKRYTIPRGGLFDLVCCPHYLFELIGWFGIVLITSHVGGLAVFWLMVCYLTGRSHSTLRWYKENACIPLANRPGAQYTSVADGPGAQDTPVADGLVHKLDDQPPIGWCRLVPFVF